MTNPNPQTGAEAARQAAQAPGWLMAIGNAVNAVAHVPVLEELLWFAYWAGALLIAPLMLVPLLLWLVYRIYQGQLVPKLDDPTGKGGIFITGCDTGFGHGLALKLAEMGWKVYAGCLTQAGADGLEAKATKGSKLTTIIMDVTKAEHIQAAVKVMEEDSPEGLYAIVNNAGVGKATVIDWTPMEEFRWFMEVNFFAVVAVTKACLPLLKKCKGRVVNVTSVAGVYLGLPYLAGYSTSKHAAEAFSTSLRFELENWGMKVITVNPSFHKTPIATNAVHTVAPAYERLSPAMKEEYGADFAKGVEGLTAKITSGAWDPEIVVQWLVTATVSTNPRANYALGLDAKYQMLPSLCLPTPITEFLVKFFVLEELVPKAAAKLKAD